MNRAWSWLWRPPSTPISSWGVVAWWELRRIPFNFVIGSYGVFCLLIFLWAITTSGRLPPSEDPVEPIALLLAPFGINLLYTLGWIVEVPARRVLPDLSPSFGPRLLMLGLILGVVLSTIPAAMWTGIRALQLLGLAR